MVTVARIDPIRSMTDESCSKQPPSPSTRTSKKLVRWNCCKVCLKATLGISMFLASMGAIGYITLVTAFPELELQDSIDGPTPNLTRVADVGALSSYAHVTTRQPLLEDGHVVGGTNASARHNVGAAATLDLVQIERLDADDLGDGSPTFIERTLQFDQGASAFLAAHPEVLGEAPMSTVGGDDDDDLVHGRVLGPHGADERRSVSKSEAKRPPFSSVVRLKGSSSSSWFSSTASFCSGTLVDDDTVLTAAHCVYKNGGYRFPQVEAHPWMAAHSPVRPSTWFSSGHADCANRIYVWYPCGVKTCRGWWGLRYPCGVNWCKRYASEPSDCTWRYSTRSILVPNEWKATACQASDSGTCSEADFQHDIALLKLKSTQGQHAGTRASTATATHIDTYGSHTYSITGYPGDRAPFMATASGPIEQVASNVLRHQIDANSGQSGSGVSRDSRVYAVHVYGGDGIDGARRIDAWWLRVLRSNY